MLRRIYFCRLPDGVVFQGQEGEPGLVLEGGPGEPVDLVGGEVEDL